MRIALVDHSFHRRTGSSRFFAEALGEAASVEVCWDESWRKGRVDPGLLRELLEGGYDRIVFFQVFWPAPLLRWLGLERAVFVPMYDDVRRRRPEWWRGYAAGRFVNFSRALDERIEAAGAERLDVRYFPEPVESAPRPEREGLVGFFWQRRASLPFRTVWKVAEGNEWERFDLHWAPDPGERRIPRPSRSLLEGRAVSTSEWFDDAEDFFALMSDADVYFAPRLHEGIGMGFLEAMARGQCVVAPDRPTHSEYIESGRNGWLYDPENPAPIPLGDARSLGEVARETCREGYRDWQRQREEIREFVADAEIGPYRDRLRQALCEAPAGSSRWRVRDAFWKRAVRRVGRTVSGRCANRR